MSRNELIAKAKAIVSGIERMPEKQRTFTPSMSFAMDYNQFRGIVLRQYPNLAALLPPSVEVEHVKHTGQEFVRQTFGEIMVYAEQIRQLVDVQSDPSA